MPQVNSTYILVGLLFGLAAIFIKPLFEINLRLYEAVGLRSFSGFWRRQAGWWLPTIRSAAIFGAFGFIALGFLAG